jgi:hypothetical protein
VRAVLRRDHVDRIEEDDERGLRSGNLENEHSEVVDEWNEIARNGVEWYTMVEADVLTEIGEQWNDARAVGRSSKESNNGQRSSSFIVQPLSCLFEFVHCPAIVEFVHCPAIVLPVRVRSLSSHCRVRLLSSHCLACARSTHNRILNSEYALRQ